MSDIETDPLWVDYRELAGAHGLRACWSTPVLVAGEVVATFAVYYREPRAPSAVEIELTAECANLVAVTLQRDVDVRARQEVENRYQALVEQLPVVTYVSLNGEAEGWSYQYVSPQIESLMGITVDQFLHQDAHAIWLRMLHPEDRDAIVPDWERAVEQEQPWMGEYRVVRDDGAVVWVRNVETVMRDPHGRAIGRQGVGFDVTTEMESLRALRSAEARYRALVEQLPAVTYLHDLAGGGDYTSPQIERLVGMTPEQWSTDWEQAIHPDDRERVRDLYQRHLARLEPFDAEYRVLTPDGRVTWISERAEAMPVGVGGARFLQGIMFDVTDLKLAEQAARESERRFREMLESASLAAVVTEQDGTVSFCNDCFAAMVGYRRDEIIGRSWVELFSPPDDEIDRLFFDELCAGRVLPQVTDEVCTRSGGRRIITWSSTPLRDPDGVVVSAARLGEDVTDRLRAERALRDSEQRRRMVTAEMLRTAEEERTRIAVELHDDTVQVMAATLMSLDRLSAALKAGDTERAGSSVRAARDTLAAAVERTRRLMFELRPPLLEAQGLDPALRDLAATAASEAGFEVSAEIRVGRYPEAVETLAYRTAQEAIVNARKHAGAEAPAAGAVRGGGRPQRRGLRRRPRLRPRPARSTAARCGCTWGWTR